MATSRHDKCEVFQKTSLVFPNWSLDNTWVAKNFPQSAKKVHANCAYWLGNLRLLCHNPLTDPKGTLGIVFLDFFLRFNAFLYFLENFLCKT